MLKRKWTTDDLGRLAGIWYDCGEPRRALAYLHEPRTASAARAPRLLSNWHRLRLPAFPACPGRRST
jgi:hypothetical protein